MTNTQQLGISVLSAPLAAIDRRALSQAWYSALHLAQDHAPVARGSTRVVALARPARLQALPARQTPPARASGGVLARAHASQTSPARPALAVERRTPRTLLARRIERALLDPRLRGARIVVMLHGAGDRVRLVALCAPSARRAVAAALEEARFALASRGIALHAGVVGEGPCS
jgi:hypothetical protein